MSDSVIYKIGCLSNSGNLAIVLKSMLQVLCEYPVRASLQHVWQFSSAQECDFCVVDLDHPVDSAMAQDAIQIVASRQDASLQGHKYQLKLPLKSQELLRLLGRVEEDMTRWQEVEHTAVKKPLVEVAPQTQKTKVLAAEPETSAEPPDEALDSYSSLNFSDLEIRNHLKKIRKNASYKLAFWPDLSKIEDNSIFVISRLCAFLAQREATVDEMADYMHLSDAEIQNYLQQMNEHSFAVHQALLVEGDVASVPEALPQLHSVESLTVKSKTVAPLAHAKPVEDKKAAAAMPFLSKIWAKLRGVS